MKTLRIEPDSQVSSQPQGLCLVHVYPPLHREGFPLDLAEARRELVVGREPSGTCCMRIIDASVSRTHFRVIAAGGELRIDDLGSSNGTFLNGSRVTGAVARGNDVIRAGNSVFLVMQEPVCDLLWMREHGIVANSPAMEVVARDLRRMAKSDSSVLILGETGTGKELLARLLHTLSGRSGSFVAVNCAAIPDTLIESTLFGHLPGTFTGATEAREGLIQQADRGTLLLDEIGELPVHLQAKLLRVLDEKRVAALGAAASVPVDVRVVAATNKPNVFGTEGGGFRPDLLARLEDLVVQVPPLRLRKSEIVPLIYHVFEQAKESTTARASPPFVEAALLYDWPRNVRQLCKAVAAALLLGKPHQPLTAADLRVSGDADVKQTNARTCAATSTDPPLRPRPSKAALLDLLHQHNWNVSSVARVLDRDRRQVYRWIEQYGITIPRRETGTEEN
jgi:transcriptional regulator with PAS, ATPase and Fis domain